MSACSAATSAHRGHARRRPSGNHAVHGGGLERRLRDLEQDWDAYKASRSAAPRMPRRRSASTGGTHASSAVVAGAGPDILGLGLRHRGSPRKLVSLLQQTGSTSTDDSAVTVKQGKCQIRRYEQGASSVCSVDAVVLAASSCSCSCECTVPCCGCGYSSSSSCSSAAASLLSPVEGGAVVGDHVMQKRRAQEGRLEMGRVGWFAAIAVVGVVVVGIMALAILEFGVDERYVEFLVPT